MPISQTASVLAFLVLSLTLLAGCGSSGDSTQSSASGLPKEIVIGAAIGKTGYLEPYDSNIAAVKQLVKETNSRGGVDGHKVRIVEADNHSEAQQAVLAAQKVAEDGANAMLFSSEALIAAASAPVAEEHDALNFTLAASEPGFGPPTTGRLSFSASPSLLGEAAARATYLYERGLRHPFLLRDTAIIYGKIDCSAFQQTWEHLGGKIAGEADFKNEDPSIATQVAEIKSSGADSIMLCSYPPGGAAAIKQIRAAGIDVPIAVSTTFDGTYWMKGLPDTSNIYGTLNSSAYDPADAASAALFRKLEKAGVDTDVSSSLLAAYAAGQLILAAIEETESVDGEKLADALERKSHPTILGPIKYTPTDHYPNRAWPIYTYSDSQPHFLTRVKADFMPQYAGG
ncbi:MAG TPA: ABC transporter substrate-binding protein [Solirubrobacterales bacterium]|jgi:branched-chain amino acid transport system substrate-binding protein|nr:ABC transporter substrate-binding protein [Solirubrobacterales bacterium]